MWGVVWRVLFIAVVAGIAWAAWTRGWVSHQTVEEGIAAWALGWMLLDDDYRRRHED